MAPVDPRPRWRVTIRAPDVEIVREVYDNEPGGAALAALAGCLTLSERYAELAPLLASFAVETERI